MRISNYWFRKRKSLKNIEYTSISLEPGKKWSTACICSKCFSNFNRTSYSKLTFDLCDVCDVVAIKNRFTDEVREKISKKVSAAYSKPGARKNKSLVTKKAYLKKENKEKQLAGCKTRSADPAYRQKLRDNAKRGRLHAIKTSCGKQGISMCDFSGFITGLDIRERERCKITVGRECLLKANFKCDICNKDGNVHAHHLNGWHWAVNERFDLNNLVCLCHSCHSYFHSCYGNKWNTREQYIEFKQKVISKCRGTI